jgi:Mg-chelatase subunit ChlD
VNSGLLPGVAALIAALSGWGGCAPANREPPPDCFSQTAPPESTGIAVAILIDNSGSMNDPTPEDRDLPKAFVARAAVAAMLDETQQFTRAHPDVPVKVAILRFSGEREVVTMLPMARYDSAAVRAALERMPRPRDGTAIGAALQAGCVAVTRAGAFRKHLLVVTDGQNTDGLPPDVVGPEIWRRSNGSVHLHFVAFDTDSARFGFLQDVQGSLLAAGNGARLRSALDEIYQQRILAESEADVTPPATEAHAPRVPR